MLYFGVPALLQRTATSDTSDAEEEDQPERSTDNNSVRSDSENEDRQITLHYFPEMVSVATVAETQSVNLLSRPFGRFGFYPYIYVAPEFVPSERGMSAVLYATESIVRRCWERRCSEQCGICTFHLHYYQQLQQHLEQQQQQLLRLLHYHQQRQQRDQQQLVRNSQQTDGDGRASWSRRSFFALGTALGLAVPSVLGWFQPRHD